MDDEPTRASAARVYELFSRAVELPPDRRGPMLDGACAGDGRLRSAVESLLAAHDDSGRFLSNPSIPGRLLGSLINGDPPRSRRQVGAYHLREVIGEGGFGTVWLADQEEPIRRTVAIKVIKAGMGTRQAIARFDLERQTLALMDHPNIARIFDAGSTDDGRPYFVMEWVDGRPITEYSRAARLSVRERLGLFRSVCSAVQHAHQKGIIHRDLKPSNVLVNTRGGPAVPKVIDFGIARALHPAGPSGPSGVSGLSGLSGIPGLFGTDDMTATLPAVLGTPQYMSPEQAGGPTADVDTRSDIYSLGVLLYELLADVPPFDPALLRSVPASEIHRIVRDVQPQRPSLRLKAAAGEAGARDPEKARAIARLAGQVQGDLDWIVGRAMEKDRGRRYATADALAEEVERYLDDLPVTAAPQSGFYRFRKFARRKRVPLTAVSLVTAALVAALLSTTVSLRRARHDRDLAGVARQNEAAARRLAEDQRAAAERERGAAERERSAAQKSAAEAREQAARLLVARQFLYRSFAPAEFPAGSAPPLEVLDYVDAVAGDGFLNGYPETEEAVRLALGKSYMSHNQWRTAERQFQIAFGRHHEMAQPDQTDDGFYLNVLGMCKAYQGNFHDALRPLEQGADYYRVRGHTQALIKVQLNQSAVLAALGRMDQAETLLRQTIELRSKTHGDSTDPLLTLDNLGVARSAENDPIAQTLWARSAALRKALGLPPRTAGTAEETQSVN